MPKGGHPRGATAAATNVGGSKTQEKIDAEEHNRLAGLGTPSAQRALTIPQRDVGCMSGMAWPCLTRMTYNSWSLMMRVILQARSLWDVIESGEGEFSDDRLATEAILRVVPPEMIPTLAIKKTAKEAWDAIKVIRVGDERVHESEAQLLCK
jgi:hypothetical protein